MDEIGAIISRMMRNLADDDDTGDRSPRCDGCSRRVELAPYELRASNGSVAPSRGHAGSALHCASCRGHLIYDPIAPDPEGVINQGQGNLTARSIQIHQGEAINERALLNLFKAVIANKRAGGWRKIQSSC